MHVVYVDSNLKEWPAEIYLDRESYRCTIFSGSVTVVDTGTFVRYTYHRYNPITGEHVKGVQVSRSNRINIINIAAMFAPPHYLLVKLSERKSS